MRKGSKKPVEDILNQRLFFMLPLEISQSLPRHKASLFSSLSPVPPWSQEGAGEGSARLSALRALAGQDAQLSQNSCGK